MGRGGPAASGILSRKAGLPPIVHGDARVLILGSLPGDASLAAVQYYAHPRNQIWTLLGRVVGCDLVAMEYSARIKAIDLAGVALWDVVCEAHRPGSLDQKIRHVRLNNLPKFAGGCVQRQNSGGACRQCVRHIALGYFAPAVEQSGLYGRH